MRYTIFFIPVFLLNIFVAKAHENVHLDSILHCVYAASEKYSKQIKSYESDVYMRTFVNTKKKNFLYRYSNSIPNFVIHDVNNDEAIIETVSKIRFEAPNSYYQDVKYVTGTLTKKRDIALLPLKFTSMDIYEESVPGETFYLPLRVETSGYYSYQLVSENKKDSTKIYEISYAPKYKNPRLLQGTFWVEDMSWRILRLKGDGSDLFFTQTFDVEMGNDSLNFLLPSRIGIKLIYKYLGNHVINEFIANLTYKTVRFDQSRTTKKQYNLGPIYRVKLDSVPLNNDTVLWDNLRPFPLTGYDRLIIENHKIKEAEAKAKADPADTVKNPNVALEIAKNMVMDTRYRHKSATFGFSGLFNPGMIGYSTVDGLAYRQNFKLGFDLERQQTIKFNAYAGYLFKKKQFYYEISGVWNYEPWKLGYLNIVAGKGNPSYSSRFLNLLQDSINSIDLDLAQYRDYYYRIYNSIEIANGLQLGVGIDYHVRDPIYPEITLPVTSKPLQTQYNFVPKLSLSWTPGQYYLTDGIQKVNVRSDYPTFKVEYAQSLGKIMRSTSRYSRFEFDISQNVRFDLMHKLVYHLGFGFFANQRDEYFNDFTYFTKRYFPETIDDGIGGGFNTLSWKIYNSSPVYVQGHFMYETPRFLLTRIPILSNGVARERIYVSQLYLTDNQFFAEIGYGIGNRFLNAAFFISFDGLKYYNVGGKAAFLL
ncbi:MAG: DUF5686 family protein [Paludibacteraceae bacterium]